MRVAAAVGLAFLIGFGLNKAVAPFHSTFLDNFAFFVTIAIALWLGDATRQRPPKE